MSNSINTSQINIAKMPDSFLDTDTFEPLTSIGIPNEAGRPMSDIETGYTVGKNNLGKYTSHPITRQPMIFSNWRPNFALEKSIAEWITSQSTPHSTIANAMVLELNINGKEEIIIIYIDTSGSTGNNIDKTLLGEINTRACTILDMEKWQVCSFLRYSHLTNPKTQVLLVEFNTNERVLSISGGNSTGVVVLDSSQVVESLCTLVMALQSQGGTELIGAMNYASSLVTSAYPESSIKQLVITDGAFNTVAFGIGTAYKSIFDNASLDSLTFFGVGEGISITQMREMCAVQEAKKPGSSRVVGIFGSGMAATLGGTWMVTNNTPRKQIPEDCALLLNKTTCLLSTQNKFQVKTGGTAVAALQKFVEYLSTQNCDSSEMTEFMAAIRSELTEGQIAKAFNPEYYNNWGKIYIESVIESIRQRCPLNTSPIDSLFYTKEDLSNLAKLQTILTKYSKIKTTGQLIERQTVYQPIDISSIRTAAKVSIDTSTGAAIVQRTRNDSTCFAPHTISILANGIQSMVKDLKPGQAILNSIGKTVYIECIIKHVGNVDLCFITEGVIMSAWHPVLKDGEQWVFPENFCTKTINCPEKYSILLKKTDSNGDIHDGTIKLANGYSTISLGHERTDGILNHPYFAKRTKIEESYCKLSGWNKGYITVQATESIIERDSVTGDILNITYPIS